MRHAVLVLLALIYAANIMRVTSENKGNYKNSSVKVIRIWKENIMIWNATVYYDPNWNASGQG